MTEPPMAPLEAILRYCADSAPSPWYPRAFADSRGLPRDTLDPLLERLRMRGLIQLTEWVAGEGQGYVLTRHGEQVLRTPRLLQQLRTGHVPAAPEESEEPGSKGRAATAYERGEAVRDALLSSSTPVVTYVLLAANIVWFVAMYAASQNGWIPAHEEMHHAFGSLVGTDLLRGQWWRLLSCCFVHFGPIHLGVNMYSLYVVGPLLERMWGHFRFLVLYLIAGLGGSCAAMIVSPVDGPSGVPVNFAGASGALWGIMTSMAVWVLLNRGFLPPELVRSWLQRLGMVFLLNVFISMVPGISASGHFGGGIVGALAGVLLNWQRFGTRPVRWLAVVGLALLPPLCIAALVADQQRDPRWQQLARRLPQLEEREQSRAENEEIDNFNKKVLPQIKPLEKAAHKEFTEQAEEVVGEHWTRRKREEVEKALPALADARARLQQAADILAAAGPYSSPRVEKARTTGQAYFAEEAKLYGLYERCLREGKDWKDEAELKAQQKRVEQAEQRWQENF